jgi:hypothetical protein
MFSIFYKDINYDTLEKLYREKDYYSLIKYCYYSESSCIHRFLHSHILDNNIIINYIYIRRQFLSNFSDFYVLEHSLRLAIKTIYICVFKISLCKEFNKSFPILSILASKFTEKFRGFINTNLFKECFDSVRYTILNEINTNTITLYDSTYIYFIEKGYMLYPAIYYTKQTDNIYKEKSKLFIHNNYEQFIETITNSYMFVTNKFENILNNYMMNNIFDLSTEFK